MIYFTISKSTADEYLKSLRVSQKTIKKKLFFRKIDTKRKYKRLIPKRRKTAFSGPEEFSKKKKKNVLA